MAEFFISIPGPWFLIIYLGFSIAIILLTKWFVLNDYTKKFEIPEPTKLDPVDIAILQYGLKGAILVAVFNLWRMRKIDIYSAKLKIVLKQKESDVNELNSIEKSIYKYLKKPKPYGMLFSETSLNAVEKLVITNKAKLNEMHLIPDCKVVFHQRFGMLAGLLLMIGFGGTKMFLGVINDKPVGLLIFLMILSVIILFVFIKPYKLKTSTLGSKLLEKSKHRFDYLKTLEKNPQMLSHDDLPYGVAIFGIIPFFSPELGLLMEKPVKGDYSQGGNGFGGCGMMGCSGGGCSGCSGCSGGGCGGCGGS